MRIEAQTGPAGMQSIDLKAWLDIWRRLKGKNLRACPIVAFPCDSRQPWRQIGTEVTGKEEWREVGVEKKRERTVSASVEMEEELKSLMGEKSKSLTQAGLNK